MLGGSNVTSMVDYTGQRILPIALLPRGGGGGGGGGGGERWGSFLTFCPILHSPNPWGTFFCQLSPPPGCILWTIFSSHVAIKKKRIRYLKINFYCVDLDNDKN